MPSMRLDSTSGNRAHLHTAAWHSGWPPRAFPWEFPLTSLPNFSAPCPPGASNRTCLQEHSPGRDPGGLPGGTPLPPP